MKKFLSFLLIILLIISCESKNSYEVKSNVTDVLSDNSNTAGFSKATKAIEFKFPRDHGEHPDFKTEWWYYTGNLKGQDSDDIFGFQLTFFRSGLSPKEKVRVSKWATNQTYLSHFTLSDISNKKFYYDERYGRKSIGLAGTQAEPFKVWIEDWYARKEKKLIHLYAKNNNIMINLYLKETKPIVLNGNKGLSQKASKTGSASYYYSQTGLETTGEISVKGKITRVSGLSWFDREWSTSVLEKNQKGWDWFSIQLDDKREIMLYQLRLKSSGTDEQSSGTFIYKDGTYRHLNKKQFSINVLKYWTSPDTGIKYPSEWNIKIPPENIDINIYPYLKNQELKLLFTYWEGAVKVSGNGLNGNGYVELTGYLPE